MTSPAFLSSHLTRTPAVATIPAGADFLRALISPLVETYRDDPLGLSRLTLFLPNRRAVRSAAVIFGEMAGDAEVSILPRLRALGDITEEDLILSGQPPAAALDLLPAADGTSRRLILARLVHQRAESEGRGADWPTALRAADLLGQFLDGLHRDDVAFSALEAFSQDDMGEDAAAHWKSSLEFLSILGSAWPEIMAANGWMDPAARRTALMKSLGEGLETESAGQPIIVAGSLGTVRATSAFMAQVAMNPNGVVILPGLDPSLDDIAWGAIESPHPQAIFRDWLRHDLNDMPRSQVLSWAEEEDHLQSRRRFLSMALRPANATDSWYEGFAALNATGDLKAACDGLSLLSSDTPDEEASLIALLLRESLDTSDETAMLVTPDRDLARRVCAKLRTWNIDVDDTGGIPLGGTFRGTFLRAVAQWLTDPASGVALMQLLNHELTVWGHSIDIARATARRIDRKLRGPKFPQWADLRASVSAALEKDNPESLPLLTLLSDHLTAFGEAHSLSEQLRQTIALGEALAATDEMPGADRLWRFEDGEELAKAFDGLLASPYLPEAPDAERFSALLDALLGNGTMRRRGVGHPRLFVYGLVEARLQTADLTVLAGLNEGVWPDAAPEDPFLSRQMRKSLGLAAPEQEIGRAAHDFEQHAARPRVVISRSARQGRSPATASRWWTRVESFLHAADLLKDVDVTPRLRDLRALREMPLETKEIASPSPSPPAAARPRRLRVTDIGKLLRDPYAIYARLILGLRPMDQLDMEVGYAERGMVYHRLYELLGQAVLDGGDAVAENLLPEVFAQYRVPTDYMILWRRQTHRALEAWSAYMQTVTREGRILGVEEEGLWSLSTAAQDIELIGRADRIDERADGTLSIVDFKTGEAPTMKQDLAFDPQLSLLALMARAGGFAKIAAKETTRIAYLPILKADPPVPIFGDLQAKGKDGKGALSGADLQAHLGEVDQRFRDVLEEMASGRRPFPSQVYPRKIGDVGDYDHLARRGEWGVRGDDGEGSGDD